jgi:hypothetical protein
MGYAGHTDPDGRFPPGAVARISMRNPVPGEPGEHGTPFRPSACLAGSAVGALAFLYLLVGLRFGVPNVFDEGHQVLGAARVLEGHVPYRDFVFLYPPGELIVLAIAFRVFGTTILVKRVVAIAIDAALAACVYLLSRRLLPGPWAVGPAAVYVLWKGGAFWPGQYQAGRALSLVCASLALLVLPESAAGRPAGGRRVAAAGALAGLGVAARLDTGLAMSLALGVSAVFVAVRAALARSTHPARRRRDALGAAWRGALPFGLGWVGSVGLVSLAVGTVAGLRDPLHDVVFFPIYYLPHEERSFPPLRDLLGLLAGETSAISYAGRVYYTSFIYVSVVVLLADACAPGGRPSRRRRWGYTSRCSAWPCSRPRAAGLTPDTLSPSCL